MHGAIERAEPSVTYDIELGTVSRMGGAALVVDRTGSCVGASAGAIALLGRGAEPVVGRPLESLASAPESPVQALRLRLRVAQSLLPAAFEKGSAAHLDAAVVATRLGTAHVLVIFLDGGGDARARSSSAPPWPAVRPTIHKAFEKDALGRARVFAWSRDVAATHPTFTSNAVAILGIESLNELATEAHFLARVHPEDRAAYQEVSDRAARDGGPFTRTFRFVRPVDARVIWLEDHGHVARDAQGEVRVVGGMCVDVTERVEDARARERLLRAEQAARASSERTEAELRALLEAAPALVAMLDRGLRYVRVNPALASLSGRAVADHLGMTLRELHGDTYADAVEPILASVLAAGAPVHNALFTVPSRQHDGNACFLVSAYPIHDGQVVAGVAMLALDVTAQRMAERRAATLANLSTIFVAQRDVALLGSLTVATLVPELADAACVVDWSRPDSVRCLAARHVDPTLAGAICAYVEGLAPSGGRFAVSLEDKSLFQQEDGERAMVRLARSDDHARHARALGATSLIVVPIRVLGAPFGALALSLGPGTRRFTASDLAFVEEVAMNLAVALESARLHVTAQRERARAEEASRTKDEFLAVVSHELRTPLNAVLGWTTMLRGGSLDSATRKRALEIIERNARAQVKLIEDILDLSRIETGKLRIRSATLDLREVVDAALEAVRPAADAKGVLLEVAAAGDVGPFAGDPDRLQQVVWNLVSNGVKFTGCGGRVSVALERDGSDVVLRVNDSGKGISEAFLPYVFDRFRQADTGSTRAHGGLGLGLAIVRQIVELHGGAVEARSAGEGRGASFIVRLPERNAHPREAPRALAPPSSASSIAVAITTTPDIRDIDVLVVDDEHDARDVLASVLRRAGAVVRTAASVDEAIQLIRDTRPDIVVSDIGMPGQDGYDLARRLRALPMCQGGRTPAVALTAYAQTEDRTNALLAGFTSHLAKPVETAELLAVISAVGRRNGRSTRRSD